MHNGKAWPRNHLAHRGQFQVSTSFPRVDPARGSEPAPHPDETLQFTANMDVKAGMGTKPAGAGTARENGADLHHRWRLHTDSNTVNPLLESLTEAVTQHMPQLHETKFLIGGYLQKDFDRPKGPSLAVLYDERSLGD